MGQNRVVAGLTGAILAVVIAFAGMSAYEKYTEPQPTLANPALHSVMVQKVDTGVWANEVGGPPVESRVIGDRVIHLPEDGQSYYLTLFTTPSWKQNTRESSFVNWFSQDQRLAGLKRQVHFNHYTADNTMYRAKFAESIGNSFPAVTLQDSNGKVVAKYSGVNVPATSDQLADLIAGDLRNYDCPNCPRPKPTPTPAPTPAPTPVPGPPVIPDSTVKPATPADKPPWWLFAAAGLVGGAAGAGSSYRKAYKV